MVSMETARVLSVMSVQMRRVKPVGKRGFVYCPSFVKL